MRALAVLGIVAGVVAGLAALFGIGPGASQPARYKIEFDNAFGLNQGGDFRIGGVRAGKTTDFEVEKRPGRPARALVTVEVERKELADLRADARCAIKPQSLIGEYFVDCQPGSSPRRLPRDGSGVVPVEQTESTIPPDLIADIMRRPYRERFSILLSQLGAGLAGRPRDLAAALRRADPGLRETNRLLALLAEQNANLRAFIRDADTVVHELRRERGQLARWVDASQRAASTTASRDPQLRATLRRLPVFLAELSPTMRRLAELADRQRPLLAEARAAAPELRRFLRVARPFARASDPALGELGNAAVEGRRTVRTGQRVVDELLRIAPEAGPTFKPIRQFLDTMDDRRRAIEDDERAVRAAPPAPDPTAITNGRGGFTGLEAIWNYLYWQSLSINGFDSVGHILRVSLSINQCSNLYTEVDPNSDLFKRCSQWLGPNLPGITTPDFSDNRAQLARLERQARQPAARVGERRGPGQPEAGPLPGQPDISKPQVTLPPQVLELLAPKAPDQLKPGELPKVLDQIEKLLDQTPRLGGSGGAPKVELKAPNTGSSSPSPAGAGDAQSRGAVQALLDYLLGP